MFLKELTLENFLAFTYCSTFVMHYFIVNLKILADAMGLGKTIMTISLLVAHSGKGGSIGSQPITQSFIESGEVSDTVHKFSNIPKKATKFAGFDKPMKQKNALTSGGNLIICPMTLLGQWKVLVLSIFAFVALWYIISLLESSITFYSAVGCIE